MHEIFENILAPFKPPRLAFCDYIADRVQRELKAALPDHIIKVVGRIEYDLDARGAWISTRKTIIIEGHNGIRYRVTVEEIE